MSGTPAAPPLMSLAPSWHESTLQWIGENCPQHLGGRGNNAERLEKALIKSGYALLEARHDKKHQLTVIGSLIPTWSLDDHNDFRKFIDAGGYTAPARAPAATVPMPGIPPAVFDGPDGPEVITLEMEAPVEPSPEEAAAAAELQNDARFGAW